MRSIKGAIFLKKGSIKLKKSKNREKNVTKMEQNIHKHGETFDTLTTTAPTKRSRIGPYHNVIL